MVHLLPWHDWRLTRHRNSAFPVPASVSWLSVAGSGNKKVVYFAFYWKTFFYIELYISRGANINVSLSAREKKQFLEELISWGILMTFQYQPAIIKVRFIPATFYKHYVVCINDLYRNWEAGEATPMFTPCRPPPPKKKKIEEFVLKAIAICAFLICLYWSL